VSTAHDAPRCAALTKTGDDAGRQCRCRARPGRPYCPRHETYRELAAQREAELKERRKVLRGRWRATEEVARQHELEELSRVLIVLDANKHRCPSVGYGETYGEVIELEQCVSYRGHDGYGHWGAGDPPGTWDDSMEHELVIAPAELAMHGERP
jgi:hypothetical protein